ncbi:hypothetical protein BJ322DRAFT_1091239 [Thelephora terrestris]|uniref:Probable RNA polymerase II nuclear localization protein SLC7A6OS n=1 Tax=Thelephora terrestris TaxID=56493 RepID=A0A9P6L1S3_9AGAM|nr:hypothetical protein BJ322DRAFT_1091239 [Thelephora terrestris]
MSVDTGEPLTILRIKRKRGEEPVDALVLSDSKRRKKGLDVFHFVQTVELEDSWNAKDIQERITALAKTTPAETESPSPSTKPGKDLAPSKAYAIVDPSPATARRPPNAPPKVVSHKELLNRAQDVQCYDAVPVSEPEETQAEVEKFIPMLEEYLKLSDIQPTTSGASSANDYVWDIFYHRTSKSTDWNKISQNIGTLTGLPASFGDPDESDSDSEVEDEGDEDSNAEDWFTNDYPDEEDVDSEEGAPPDTDEASEESGPDVGNDNDSDEEWMTSRMYRR